MSGVTLFKSQDDFYRRNRATMKTARELTAEAEKGAVDLRYAYKLLPPGSKNFFAKAWEQTWGNDALMYNANRVDSKRPVIEKINLDQPETGSLPTTAPKNGLGSEGLICDTLEGDTADYLRNATFLRRLRNPIAGGDSDGELGENSSVEGGEDEEGEQSLNAPAIALADGDAAHGEAAWGNAPGDNKSAMTGRRTTASAKTTSKIERLYRAAPRMNSVRSGASGKSAASVAARSVGGLSKGTASSGESFHSVDGPGAPGRGLPSGPKAESDPRAATPAARAAAPKGTNIPKASSFPAANALAKKVRAAKGAPPEGMAAERKAMGVKERNRFDKWVKAMGYEM